MTNERRQVMMKLAQEFMKALEEITKKGTIPFELGKCDFSIDPKNLEKFKIKAEFEIKKEFIDKIRIDADSSQTKVTAFETAET